MLSDLIIRNECAHALAILSVATVVKELVELGGVDAASVARMRLAGPIIFNPLTGLGPIGQKSSGEVRCKLKA